MLVVICEESLAVDEELVNLLYGLAKKYYSKENFMISDTQKKIFTNPDNLLFKKVFLTLMI